MNEIKEFFNNIGKDEINQEQTGLLKNGLIDSLDIMAIINQIEKKYGILDAKYISEENFDSFKSISNMLKQAYGK